MIICLLCDAAIRFLLNFFLPYTLVSYATALFDALFDVPRAREFANNFNEPYFLNELYFFLN